MLLLVWMLSYVFPIAILAFLFFDAKEKGESLLWVLGSIGCPIVSLVYFIKTRGLLYGILVWIVLYGIVGALQAGYLALEGKTAVDANRLAYENKPAGIPMQYGDEVTLRDGTVLRDVLVDEVVQGASSEVLVAYLIPKKGEQNAAVELRDVERIVFRQESEPKIFDRVFWQTDKVWKDLVVTELAFSQAEQRYSVRIESSPPTQPPGWYSAFRSIQFNRCLCPACYGVRRTQCMACNGTGKGDWGDVCKACNGERLVPCLRCTDGFARADLPAEADPSRLAGPD